jgi:hypothetical protein
VNFLTPLGFPPFFVHKWWKAVGFLAPNGLVFISAFCFLHKDAKEFHSGIPA